MCKQCKKSSKYIIKDIILIIKLIKNGFQISKFFDIDTLCDLKIRNGTKKSIQLLMKRKEKATNSNLDL
jgi:hypothetical protein